MKSILSPLFALLIFTVSAQAAEAPASVDQMLNTLLTAIEQNDSESFNSVCDETMQNAMKKETLQRVHDQVSKAMVGGYTKTYWGDITRPDDIQGYFWKLAFTNKPEHDLVAEMWVKDGKVAGFFLR
ncbi:hypothetical protein [Cerasicoccus frondis]|uniref:hypothetical protein n=1 Tax=Cerasicoccus frondis TaxID=490090 RepID=UPI002852C18E|nr:hypothetical protein [Cerasicoccus frondis]